MQQFRERKNYQQNSYQQKMQYKHATARKTTDIQPQQTKRILFDTNNVYMETVTHGQSGQGDQ